MNNFWSLKFNKRIILVKEYYRCSILDWRKRDTAFTLNSLFELPYLTVRFFVLLFRFELTSCIMQTKYNLKDSVCLFERKDFCNRKNTMNQSSFKRTKCFPIRLFKNIQLLKISCLYNTVYSMVLINHF